ncbi:N-acylneuraminate cytidylyltransferase-like [Amphibalanus amphitrite]|uniref:N-acylneuraminate cytidylyltransferase-like n=1 Tax=Amphibalanus amphitrite TaxID=1232801 RepID=UPI001C90EE0A|nr:N-acylneuraminate cytidylyltransferase-like [Amphibalanus amphitrite]
MASDFTKMAEVCILILARGGSKGIPRKNMVHFVSKSLIAHCISTARMVTKADSVWVSTDDSAIAAESEAAGARVHHRSAATSTDTASSLSAVLEFLGDRPEVGTVALLQCTSPLTRPEDVNRALEMLDGSYDSVFSLVRHRPGLIWRETEDGGLEPVNFDPLNRPRRQDLPSHLQESGNFYVTRAALVRSERQLQAGRRGYVEVPPETAIDIDTPSDLEVARLLARRSLTGSQRSTTEVNGSDGSGERSTVEVRSIGAEEGTMEVKGSIKRSADGAEESVKRSATEVSELQ